MSKPVISIIGTTYNQAKPAERTIEIWCRQNFSLPYELIVLDDGSTDNTREVIESLQERYPDKIRYFYFDSPGFIRNCTLLFNTAIRRLMRSNIAVIQWYDRIPSSFDALTRLYEPHVKSDRALVTFLTRHILGSSSRDVYEEAEVDRLLASVDWQRDPGELVKIMGTPGGHCFPDTMNESACFSVRREHLLAVNGYDERYFKVANYSNIELYGRLKAYGLNYTILENDFTFHQPHPSNRDDIQTQLQPDQVIVRNKIIRNEWGSILPVDMVPPPSKDVTVVVPRNAVPVNLTDISFSVEVLVEPDNDAALQRAEGAVVVFCGEDGVSAEQIKSIVRAFQDKDELGCLALYGATLKKEARTFRIEPSNGTVDVAWGFPFAIRRNAARANGIRIDPEQPSLESLLDLSHQMRIWAGKENASLSSVTDGQPPLGQRFLQRWDFLHGPQ